MIKNLLQRICSDSASEFAVRVGEQVRIGQVQYPNRIAVSCVIARLNKAYPFDGVLVAVMLGLVRSGLFNADVIGLFVG